MRSNAWAWRVCAGLAVVAALAVWASEAPAGPGQASAVPADPAAVPTSTVTTCTLVGRVQVPPRKSAGGAKAVYAGKTTEKVAEPDPPVCVVWMAGVFPPADASRVKPVELVQEGLQFRPAVLAVQAGTPVVFPNRDPIYHSVFSYSGTKKFDLGRYRPGEEPPAVVFDKPGTVSLFCEVHDHMRGSIVVVDSPHFARTDAQGSFRLEGLPAGRHTFKVWLSPKETVERSVELKPGENTVDWTGPA